MCIVNIEPEQELIDSDLGVSSGSSMGALACTCLHANAHNFCGRGDTSTAKKTRTRGKIGQIPSIFLDYGLQSITMPQSDYTVIHFRSDYRKTVLHS